MRSTLLIVALLSACGGDDGGGTQTDAAHLAACTGESYDSCPTDKNGNLVTCNMMGRCKATPNDCTAQ